MKKYILLTLTIGAVNYASSQCSEAENPTMKKYAELTRNSANTQGCSMCAWLANLFCIAENGLYENDKAGVEKSINDTKATIKQMGDPICCPELLTKSIKWGQPKTKQGTENNSDNVAETKNKTATEIQSAIQHGVNYVDNIIQTNENYKDMSLSKDVIEQNSRLKTSGYNSKQEIEDEYQYRLQNINSAGDMFVNSRVRNSQLQVERGKMSNDQVTSVASSMFGELEIYLAEKEALKSIDQKKKKLYHQKIYLQLQFDIIDAINKDNVLLIDKETLQKILQKTGEDYTAFKNHTLIEGWNPTIKMRDFKKLVENNGYPKMFGNQFQMGLYGAFGLYEIKKSSAYINIGQSSGLSSFKRGYRSFSPYHTLMYKQKLRPPLQYIKNSSDNILSLKVCYEKKENTVVQVVKQTVKQISLFSTEKLKEYQNILLKAIEDKSNMFNIPAEHFNVNISTIDPAPYGYHITSFQLIVTVVWTDKNQKAYAMVGEIYTDRPLNGVTKELMETSAITLRIMEGDLSLASEIVLKDLNDFINYNSDKQLLHGNNIYDNF